ncbi:hypothetical protein JDS77_05745 [Bacillus cereus group sp. N28]|uniref:hypothetical protein n=1 Tax=Bacillus cereus group sp. N28 TaxID=2794593 RepID=UPI0018F3FF82|nr:hypothetical protein [Bacillus cereus group sp. N28]MBJ7957211.1 hypothetical protein [Bacillus cereus group sp. N28]
MRRYEDRIEAANAHIDAYVISNEDWHDADDAKKIRLMNTAAGNRIFQHYGRRFIRIQRK